MNNSEIYPFLQPHFYTTHLFHLDTPLSAHQTWSLYIITYVLSKVGVGEL